MLREDEIFFYIPSELWKDMAERFLDPISFGRLRRVCRVLRDKLDEESKKKVVERHTVRMIDQKGKLIEIFLNTKHEFYPKGKGNGSRMDSFIAITIFPL